MGGRAARIEAVRAVRASSLRDRWRTRPFGRHGTVCRLSYRCREPGATSLFGRHVGMPHVLLRFSYGVQPGLVSCDPLFEGTLVRRTVGLRL